MALEAIVAAKRVEVRARRDAVPETEVRRRATRSDRDFAAALSAHRPGFILEVKPASPSEGHLRAETDLEPALASYARFADAVSVLTDRAFFNGSFELLRRVRARVPQPILCKDFVIDPYQVYEARLHGADAVLLMLSVLDDDDYRAAAGAARSLGMGILTEVHSADEMRRAGRLGAEVIGINNRDLTTLEVDLETTGRLARLAPAGALLVAESGIRSHGDVRRVRSRVDAMLVGTTLMRAADPGLAVRRLVFGPTKVCGLTREADAVAAAELGATHGGVIFAPESPRAMTVGAARSLVAAAPLQWVGVFADQPFEEVAAAADALALAAVQLHGEEPAEYLAALRPRLPTGCAIWKARPVGRAPIGPPDDRADATLLDRLVAGRRGGTGRTFDWSLLEGLDRPERFVLSGGLDSANVERANRTPVEFHDVCSGVESAPGIKDPDRLARFFAGRRTRTRDSR